MLTTRSDLQFVFEQSVYREISPLKKPKALAAYVLCLRSEAVMQKERQKKIIL